jgi:hypothetical protein
MAIDRASSGDAVFAIRAAETPRTDALEQVQADGLRAANQLLERVLAVDDDDLVPPPTNGNENGSLIGAWAELFQRFAAGTPAPSEPGGSIAAVDASVIGPPARLVVGPSAPAKSSVAELWLHNGTASAVGPLTLRCGALSASDGTGLDGIRVCFEPPELDALQPGASRPVAVFLDAPCTPPPGIYRGTIQADGAPALWLVIEVQVEPC